MISALGFDLDNTLYDQRQYVFSYFEQAGKWLAETAGVRADDAERVLTDIWIEKTSYYKYLFDDALRELNCHDPQRVQDLVRLYHAHRVPLELYPGVAELLERLRSRMPLFLVTDGHAATQRFKVQALGVADYFRVIVYTADYGTKWHKPSDAPFRFAAEQLDLDARQCWYIGDNPHCDIPGARAAGMLTIQVLTGPFASHDSIGPEQPDYHLEHVTQLEQLIQQVSGLD